MLDGVSIGDLDAFGYGFFQDIVNAMDVLDINELTRKDAIRYRDLLLKYREEVRVKAPCKGCNKRKKEIANERV